MDLQVTQAACKRGKEKAMGSNVEDVIPLKRDKRPSPLGSAPVLDALREGGEQTTSLLKKMGLETDQVGEPITQDILRISHMITNLLCRAKAVENVV
nr:uncharacterized protein LOC109184184 [Ipomoea batatas]